MAWIAAIVGLVVLALLLYWQLIIAEGTYLGPRVVVLLYDWSAHVYERIKQYDAGAEQWFLGLPLAWALEMIPEPLVLDVATGTGRLPRALLRQENFDGSIIGLDLSRRMLGEAVRRTAQFADRLTYVWQDARSLPFDDDVFDAVTCLEALEFTPHPRRVLAELVRVLRPGGVLLVTNRIGPDARFLPARAFSPDEFGDVLAALPLEDVKVRSWQQDYDLGWAVKVGEPRGGGVRALADLLRCPACGGAMEREGQALRCTACETRYRVASDGVVELARPVD
jgi:SAM-dependent methyltransferase